MWDLPRSRVKPVSPALAGRFFTAEPLRKPWNHFYKCVLSRGYILSAAPFDLPIAFSSGFPCSSAGKESACSVGDLGFIPGLGRSLGEGKGYPLQYSGLENSMDCISMGSQRVGYEWVTSTYTHTYTHTFITVYWSVSLSEDRLRALWGKGFTVFLVLKQQISE